MKDKTIFIIGGANGIGRGLVEHFVEVGATVAFCDIDKIQGAITAEQGWHALRHRPNVRIFVPRGEQFYQWREHHD